MDGLIAKKFKKRAKIWLSLKPGALFTDTTLTVGSVLHLF